MSRFKINPSILILQDLPIFKQRANAVFVSTGAWYVLAAVFLAEVLGWTISAANTCLILLLHPVCFFLVFIFTVSCIELRSRLLHRWATTLVFWWLFIFLVRVVFVYFRLTRMPKPINGYSEPNF